MFHELSIAAFFLALAETGGAEWKPAAGFRGSLRNRAGSCPLAAVCHQVGIPSIGQPSPVVAAQDLGLPEQFCLHIASLSDFWGARVRWSHVSDIEIEAALGVALHVTPPR